MTQDLHTDISLDLQTDTQEVQPQNYNRVFQLLQIYEKTSKIYS